MRPRVAESTETASPPLVPARRRPFASTICPRGAGRTPRRRGMRTVRRREGWVTKSLRPVLCRVLAKHARLETPLPSDFRRRLMTREGKRKTRCKKATFAREGRPVAAGPVGRLAAQMNLERVITALAPTDVVQRAPVEIFDLAYDTRAVEPGALFFCVSGERHDGHGFAREAVQKGAVALVVERALELERAFRELLEAGNRSCALEATSHGSELRRLDGVRFAALAFTNLGQDHLDFHGTLERYFEAKRRLFVEGERPPAAVNVDDEHGRQLAEELRSLGHERLLTFGFAGDADIRPEHLELDESGARLRAAGIALRTRLRGRFNVENVLAGVAVARLLGIEDEPIAAGVAALDGVPGRFEAVEAGQPFAVVVDYSHKPDALENVLRTARGLARNRVICVFGCGGDGDRAKRPLMGRIASELADVAIVTTDNPRSEDPQAIIAEVLEGTGANAEVELDRAAAIERAVALAQEGDVVVIAGKGHEQGQEFAGRTIRFDDREVAREALQAVARP